MKTYYHFTSSVLRDGSALPAIGEWLEVNGAIELCHAGLHASEHPFDALSFAPGELLHRVELAGKILVGDDKVCAERRRIIATIDSEPLLRTFARKVALDVIGLWEAPPIVREYLETGNEEIRAAAWDAARAAAWAAAWDAAWDAARDAAWDAARAAARAAAWDAARDAARAAARAAARDAAISSAREQQRALFARLVDEVFAAAEVKQ